jgi:hypothetical protein
MRILLLFLSLHLVYYLYMVIDTCGWLKLGPLISDGLASHIWPCRVMIQVDKMS